MTKTNRIISSVILATSFPVMAILPSHPASLLFIFISGNKWVGTARLALALILLALSFGLIRLPHTASKTMLGFGAGLIGFGLFALFETSVGSFLYDYMKILDVMIVLEAGIIFCSLAVNLSQPRQLQPKTERVKRTKAKVATA